jgi:hypothetical protein
LWHLDDLEGQPQVVKLAGVVDPVEGDAPRLVQVVVLGGFLQKEFFRKFFVAL